MLESLERKPEDLSMVAKVSDLIIKEAQTLPDASKTRKVERLVRSSELVADVRGLRLAYQTLRRFKAE